MKVVACAAVVIGTGWCGSAQGQYAVRVIDGVFGDQHAVAMRVTESGMVVGLYGGGGGDVGGVFIDARQERQPGERRRWNGTLTLYGGAMDASTMSGTTARNLNDVWAGSDATSWDPACRRPVLWSEASGAHAIELPPGMTHAIAYDLNDGEEVVGCGDFISERGERGGVPWRWSRGDGLQTLPLPKWTTHARAQGINNQGVIVGSVLSTWRSKAKHAAHESYLETSGAVMWVDGRVFDLGGFVDLQRQGWTLVSASDINNQGEIAATARDEKGVLRPLLLSPLVADINHDGSVDVLDVIELRESSERAQTDRSGAAIRASLDQIVDAKRSARPEMDRRVERAREMVLWRLYGEDEVVADPAYVAWRSEGKDSYHRHFNPECYGCGGSASGNPLAPNGAPGWPGDAIGNPYFPHGGPGGDGADSDGTFHAGNGGDGGDASALGGDGGNGGNGGNSAAWAHGGNGGRGGDGGTGSDRSGDEGTGGRGGSGGNGGCGGELGGNGGSGGAGGDGGVGGSNGGDGGRGGRGGDGAAGGVLGNGGAGGDGGVGGEGGLGAIGGAGGDGGDGANGGVGNDRDGLQPRGGAGGNGGRGGDGGASRTGGRGGDGGRGGKGVDGAAPGGKGGDGGRSGVGGGPGGGGGVGGGGNPSGSSGGNGYPPPG